MKTSVLVTGGTGALGTAVTIRLLNEGYRVAATWVHEQEVARLIEEAGNPDLICVNADVTDPLSIDEAIRETEVRQGPIAGLVHLVGAWSGGSLTHDHSLETWNEMLDLNLTSAFLCCRAVLPGMIERDRGRMVLVSSRTAEQERSGQVGYAVAKAGLQVLAETIVEENRLANVTANVVAPSTLDTPSNREAMPSADIGGWVSVDDVAACIAFLVSDAAGAIRGARVPIYGGV